MPSRNAGNQDTVTGGNWQNQDTLTVPELESNGNCYAEKKFPTTRCPFYAFRARRFRGRGEPY